MQYSLIGLCGLFEFFALIAFNACARKCHAFHRIYLKGAAGQTKRQKTEAERVAVITLHTIALHTINNIFVSIEAIQLNDLRLIFVSVCFALCSYD